MNCMIPIEVRHISAHRRSAVNKKSKGSKHFRGSPYSSLFLTYAPVKDDSLRMDIIPLRYC